MKIPGLFDLQVNGYKSVDFCSAELTEDAFVYASRELIKNGTSLFLPTVITSSPEVYQRNLKLMVKAIVKAGLEEHIPGFHLEGPFISPEDGARGAHAKEWVSKPDTGLLDQMILWSENKIKLLTVAAEIPGMEMLCRYAVSKGIKVSVGHSHALKDDIRKLTDNGATLYTHLGNGIAKMQNRQDNQIIAALANDAITPMLITDSFHVTADLIKITLKIKGVSNTIIVSDQSAIAGMPPGKYHSMGNDIMLDDTGYLYNPTTGFMVGSSRTILECANYLLSLNLVTVSDVVRMAFHNPLFLMGCKAPASNLVYSEKENKILVSL